VWLRTACDLVCPVGSKMSVMAPASIARNPKRASTQACAALFRASSSPPRGARRARTGLLFRPPFQGWPSTTGPPQSFSSSLITSYGVARAGGGLLSVCWSRVSLRAYLGEAAAVEKTALSHWLLRIPTLGWSAAPQNSPRPPHPPLNP
jgi:hypothetical protein